MRKRLIGLTALTVPVLSGIIYLRFHGAPSAYVVINSVAFGLAAIAVLGLPVIEQSRARRIFTVTLVALLFLPLLTGPHINGIARWLPLGPFTLHSGALILPALVVLAARDEDFAPPILLAALLAASLQPAALQPTAPSGFMYFWPPGADSGSGSGFGFGIVFFWPFLPFLLPAFLSTFSSPFSSRYV